MKQHSGEGQKKDNHPVWYFQYVFINFYFLACSVFCFLAVLRSVETKEQCIILKHNIFTIVARFLQEYKSTYCEEKVTGHQKYFSF